MNRLIILFPFLLLMMAGIASAQPTSIPSGILYYVPINLTNSQSTATPAPFQQMINITESDYSSYINYSGSEANFEIFNGTGSVWPAWIESNDSGVLHIWVKLPNGIPADSKVTLYLGFATKTTNLLNSSGTEGIGEAPQLSPTYAEYDDGAEVFPYYQRWGGLSALPSGWTLGADTSNTFNSNNTILTFSTSTENVQSSTYMSAPITSAPIIYELYGLISIPSSIDNAPAAFGVTNSTTGFAQGPFMVGGSDFNAGGGTNVYFVVGNTNTGVLAPSTTSIYTSSVLSTTSMTGQIDYGTAYSFTSSATALTYLEFDFFSGTGGTITDTIYWTRARAYPPNGVMPSVSFGAVQSITPQLTITPNPATYGQSITLSATCANGDTCAIDYPSLGTAIATGTSSVNYTYSAYSLGAGSYSSFYADDPTLATNSTAQTLTIDKATVSPSCSYNGKALTNATTNPTLLAQGYLNCTMPTHNNQLSASLYYNGSAVVSGASVSYLTKFDDYNNSFVYNTTGNTNYTAGSFSGHLNYLLYQLITATNLGSSAYETATVNPQYTLNITKAATNSTLTLNVQGKNVSAITQSIPSGTNLFSPTYAIPLQSVNDTTYTFNAILSVRGSFGTITKTINTMTQQELQNYFPVISVSPNPNIVGDNISINTAITQKTALDLANVSGDVILGNKTITEQINSLYNYTAKVLSFIPSQYKLTMPTVGTPQSYTAKSVVKLSFGNQSVYRNATVSFNDYYPALLSCNATTPTAVKWDFYNASNPTSAITANVLMKGYFTLINNFFKYKINGTAAGWTATATAPSYSTCIYPNFASFNFNSTILAATANTATTQTFYQLFHVSNKTNTQDTYLLNIPNPVAYEVFVENLSTVSYIPALVKVLLYDPNTNSTIQISELKTGANSGTALTLQDNDTYKLIAYTPNGKSNIGSTNFFVVSGACSSGICDEIVPVSPSSVTLPSDILHNIQHSCTITNNNATNSSSISCSYSSINGASYNVSLFVNKTNAIYNFVNDNICTKSVNAGSGTLNCIVNDTNSTQYIYTLALLYNGTSYPLRQGLVGTQQTSYGPEGYFLMLLLLLTLALGFITKNANFAVVGFTAGWVAGSLLGLVFSPALTDGFLVITAAFILYLINRR